MVFSLKYGFTAALALFLSAASGVAALDSGNYTIVTTSNPKQILGSDIPATFVTSTIENLDLFGNWPVEWYRWSIHKLPDLPNNYTFMLNGRYSMMGANDVYIGQYVNALTTQVWVLEPASNGSDQYRILSADGTRKWAFPAADFPLTTIQIQPIPPNWNTVPGFGPAADLFTFSPM